jgi:hypothetical protein
MGYYQGDYYRGDPGFFSVLGGLAKKAVGFIPGVGPALSAGLETLTRKTASSAIVKAGSGSLLKRVGAGAKQVIAKHPVLSAAGAAGAVGLAAGGVAGRMLRGHGGGGKHHRRMNPCNVRALRRAIRRAHGFEKIARKVMRFSSPHKHKKFAGFKHAKKRS